ncbi:hypothetical protein C922_04846 [Plasmodium inui San Antonio 1]|uniref:Uncharacterized protein n=1 Tax=Plasmodium inui San Antonio 1 TaxID=1237626 RepID=W7AHR3_9APIC|nr:hypothetical protein C922_04846 [Plasmodium inui San Antonio 1]EUD64806.1 hypothetical protein C922_04846 [Plasmodium inui San Antonio 1]
MKRRLRSIIIILIQLCIRDNGVLSKEVVSVANSAIQESCTTMHTQPKHQENTDIKENNQESRKPNVGKELYQNSDDSRHIPKTQGQGGYCIGNNEGHTDSSEAARISSDIATHLREIQHIRRIKQAIEVMEDRDTRIEKAVERCEEVAEQAMNKAIHYWKIAGDADRTASIPEISKIRDMIRVHVKQATNEARKQESITKVAAIIASDILAFYKAMRTAKWAYKLAEITNNRIIQLCVKYKRNRKPIPRNLVNKRNLPQGVGITPGRARSRSSTKPETAPKGEWKRLLRETKSGLEKLKVLLLYEADEWNGLKKPLPEIYLGKEEGKRLLSLKDTVKKAETQALEYTAQAAYLLAEEATIEAEMKREEGERLTRDIEASEADEEKKAIARAAVRDIKNGVEACNDLLDDARGALEETGKLEELEGKREQCSRTIRDAELALAAKEKAVFELLRIKGQEFLEPQHISLEGERERIMQDDRVVEEIEEKDTEQKAVLSPHTALRCDQGQQQEALEEVDENLIENMRGPEKQEYDKDMNEGVEKSQKWDLMREEVYDLIHETL